MSRLKLILGALVLALLFAAPPATAEFADVVINKQAEANGVRPVVFPHWFHRIRFRCVVCHTELGINMGAGSNPITMQAIGDGKYCGACHNGTIAWSAENCFLCHSGKPGLQTGIKGQRTASGPGIW